MIIEDSGEIIKSKHYVGNVLKKRGTVFKREEIRIKNERVGDYIGIHDKNILWMAERKRDKDFVKSVKDGRLDKQLEKMSRLYNGVKYLLFEGDWKRTIKDYYYFYSKLQSMRIKCAWYGVTFVECKDEEATASFLLLLEKNCKKFQTIEMNIYKPIIVRSDDQRLIPLIACRSIGKKTAKLLLDKFESVETIIALAINKPEVITSLKGIGNSVIIGIKELFSKKEMVIFEQKSNENRRYGSSVGGNGLSRRTVHAKSKPSYLNNANIYRRRKNNKNPIRNGRKL